jgi:hypothetical protein
MRLDQLAQEDSAANRDIEFISFLNWITLSEARLGCRLDHVLDVRFSSQAPGWQASVQKLSHNRDWSFLPLEVSDNTFDDLCNIIKDTTPKAILIPAEMDRIADPALMLKVIKEAATPGTFVFIASSCADGLEYEILGGDSPSFTPLDRLNLFSVAGFETLAKNTGFDVLEIATPGRFDAVILDQYFKSSDNTNIPFWSGFFHDADKPRLHDLQLLLQRSLRSGVMRFVLKT